MHAWLRKDLRDDGSRDLQQKLLGLLAGIIWDCSLYGSWEALDSLKTLPRGTPTFSTPGEAIPRLFEKSIFLVPRRPQWARAQWARAHGPNGPGPMGQGPWANGQGPMGQWARAHGPNGPGPMGQWARAHGPNGPGPMGPSFPAIGITIFTREKLACRDSVH